MENVFEYTVKRSSRKTVAIMISRNGEIKVKAPYDITENEITNIINSKNNWIRKSLKKFNNDSEKFVLPDFKEGEAFPFKGKYYRVRFVNNTDNAISLEEEFLINEKYSEKVKEVLKYFYKMRADTHLKKRIKELSEITGLRYKDVKITSGKTRLGSCTNNNRIRLSYFLVMLPEEISDYIIYHELVHIAEKNHSQKFWKYVESFVPDYNIRKKWIKDNFFKYRFL